MVALCKREPDVQFYFIIGGDMIDTLHSWYKIEELKKLVKFVGLNRPGSNSYSNYEVLIIDAPEIDLSSTMIRHRLATGGTLKFLLPEGVEAYIRKEGLYGTR
jgi:nicotinate-nucleotide adenylyltransferase